MNDLTLLYVEDDVEALEDTSYLLSEFFSQVHTAKDGREALRKYHALNPDVLVLDINLPGLSGMEVASEVRKTDISTPILFITAFSDKGTLLKAINVSAIGYIVKPYKISELKEAINKIIKKKLNVTEELRLVGNFIWRKKDKNLTFDSQNVNLTKNERDLLELLCDNENQFFKPLDIEISLSKTDHNVKENNVVQLISRFKNKILKKYDSEPFFIENVYGLGYKILTKQSSRQN